MTTGVSIHIGLNRVDLPTIRTKAGTHGRATLPAYPGGGGTKAMTDFTHSLAVLIGIDAYGPTSPRLTTAVNDARLAEIITEDRP